MRSVGSPPIFRILGVSLVSVTGLALSSFGCSDAPVRKSGADHNSSTLTGGTSGTGGSAAGTTGSPGGTTGDPSGGTGTAGTDPASGGTGPSGGTGTAGDSSSGGSTSGSGGDLTSGTGGSTGGMSGGTAEAGSGGNAPCQMANYTFAPKIPTVFMLVDQSGSMFDCQVNSMGETNNECTDHANTSWYPLKDGALQVIQALEADVRFGFGSIGGEIGNGCPNPMLVSPDFNNYGAISTLYNSLLAPQKGETPVSKMLDAVGELLLADDSPGDRFILFVTDGEPDYCNDGDGMCPADSAVYKLQKLFTDGIRTLVFGLPAPTGVSQASPSILAAFANAGAGEPVLRVGGYDELKLWDECNFKPPWAADLVETGLPNERGSELGIYSPEGGAAPVYRPDITNQQALVNLLTAALSGVKSCTFDLSNVNGQSIKVDLNKLGEASIAIEGTTVPQDATNGWSMASQTQLVLNGTACDTWRTPENDDIAFNFPCNTIIFE